MAAMQAVKCKRCGDKFEARVADIKRGWGKFCSKSCKAIKQTYGRDAFKQQPKQPARKDTAQRGEGE